MVNKNKMSLHELPVKRQLIYKNINAFWESTPDGEGTCHLCDIKARY